MIINANELNLNAFNKINKTPGIFANKLISPSTPRGNGKSIVDSPRKANFDSFTEVQNDKSTKKIVSRYDEPKPEKIEKPERPVISLEVEFALPTVKTELSEDAISWIEARLLNDAKAGIDFRLNTIYFDETTIPDGWTLSKWFVSSRGIIDTARYQIGVRFNFIMQENI